MARDARTQRVVLGGLLTALVVVVAWQLWPASGSSGPAAPARQAQRPGQAPRATPAETLSAGVGLDRLARLAPVPADGGRDPFVLGASRPDGGPDDRLGGQAGTPMVPVASVPVVPLPPPGPPPPPPITVKFIGVVQRGDVGRVAVLSDGRNVYYGREGEIVDGLWRIVRIGEESLQIEYVDGRGRQTVRLTG